jgi:hypothetical protein
MMVGPVAGYTPTYNFAKVRYDVVGWSALEHGNWTQLDALLNLVTGLPGVKGVWANSTPYIIGDRTVDGVDGGVYRCLVAHTSAASGTFSADRAANPTYWEVLVTTPVFIGNWTTATAYSSADIVAFNTYDYYYCLEGHTAGVFAADLAAGKWTLIWQGSTAVNAANAAASAAATSFDNLDDRYLGSYAADPTLDNDGNALLEGAMYWNSVSKSLRIYNGTTWTASTGGGGMFKGDLGTTGTRAGDIFRVTEQQLDVSTTIAGTENAHAPGPLTIATGVTLTVSSGGNLVIT